MQSRSRQLDDFIFHNPCSACWSCLPYAHVPTSNNLDFDKQVVLWLNKIGPFHNPQETYPFYSLPFCQPTVSDSDLAKSQAGIGEVLEGNQLVDSGLKIEFLKDTNGPVKLCTKELTEQDAGIFKYAVSQHYW